MSRSARLPSRSLPSSLLFSHLDLQRHPMRGCELTRETSARHDPAEILYKYQTSRRLMRRLIAPSLSLSWPNTGEKLARAREKYRRRQSTESLSTNYRRPCALHALRATDYPFPPEVVLKLFYLWIFREDTLLLSPSLFLCRRCVFKLTFYTCRVRSSRRTPPTSAERTVSTRKFAHKRESRGSTSRSARSVL